MEITALMLTLVLMCVVANTVISFITWSEDKTRDKRLNDIEGYLSDLNTDFRDELPSSSFQNPDGSITANSIEELIDKLKDKNNKDFKKKSDDFNALNNFFAQYEEDDEEDDDEDE